MARKKGKPISFDGMVKFFMQYYNIPTKKDLEKVVDQINRIEQVMKAMMNARTLPRDPAGRPRKSTSTASDRVLDVIKKESQGMGIAQIQAKTGFDEKKLRNIIYQLNRTGKIRRKNRGIYTV
jgi:predicted transcriptional regulator